MLTETPAPIRTLVVDDEPLARERIQDLLAQAPGFQLAGACGDGLQALAFLARQPVDLLLLDIQMPGLGGPARPGLVVEQRGRYRLVPMAEIHCLEATGNYVCLHCEQGSPFLRGTLASLESRLDPAQFCRTHRSWIVNLEQVLEARPMAKGGWSLFTRAGHEVPVSLPHRAVVQRFLGRDSSRLATFSSQKG